MYRVYLDYHATLVHFDCVDWGDVKRSIEVSKRKWPGIDVVGVLNKELCEKERLEIRFVPKGV